MESVATQKKVQVALADPIFESALSGVAGAVAVSSETAQTVLDMPDAALGRIVKERITLFQGSLSGLELGGTTALARREDAMLKRVPLPPIPAAPRAKASPRRLDMHELHAEALDERRLMVVEKKLLDTSEMVEATGLVRQALTKAVSTGRMFTVHVGSTPYYPAFYAHSTVDRKVLAKVTRNLQHLPGWLKLDFFEAPNGALGDVSPLDALAKGRVAEVLELADAYGKQAGTSVPVSAEKGS